jgi:hypothetical protein
MSHPIHELAQAVSSSVSGFVQRTGWVDALGQPCRCVARSTAVQSSTGATPRKGEKVKRIPRGKSNPGAVTPSSKPLTQLPTHRSILGTQIVEFYTSIFAQ